MEAPVLKVNVKNEKFDDIEKNKLHHLIYIEEVGPAPVMIGDKLLVVDESGTREILVQATGTSEILQWANPLSAKIVIVFEKIERRGAANYGAKEILAEIEAKALT